MKVTVFAVTLFLLFISCRKEELNILPSQIDKEVRETLGTQIREALVSDTTNLLLTCPIHDTILYPYVQTLYNQATNRLILDRHSPTINRWTTDREWKVFILDKEVKNIFIIPGGDIFITTGLLKSLKYENELYYLFAYEACLMSERHLLNELIERFNTNTLYHLAFSEETEVTTIEELAALIPDLVFDAETTMTLDEMTALEICSTSIMNRLGICNILEYASEEPDWKWLESRGNYSGRMNYVEALEVDANCGEFVSNGNYQRKVLDILN